MKVASLTRVEKWVWAVIALYFLLVLSLGLSHHWGYITSLNDLGIYDQVVWATLHGQFMQTTVVLDQPGNWLGEHFNPVLLLFVPLYAIVPRPEWFVLVQAFALAVAAWPIYLLAKRVCQSETTGLLWVVSYLANPFLLSAAAWELHTVMLAAPCIAYALLAIEQEDRRKFLLSCFPLLLIHEQMGLTVAMLGVLWGLRNGQWKFASAAGFLGVAHAALVLGAIMPLYSPTGAHPMMADNLGQMSRYGWLGHSVGEIAYNLVSHPFDIAQAVLVDQSGWKYLVLLLIPLVGLPLAAPLWLLPVLPDLAANLLSANPMPRSVFSYHSVTLVPVLAVAAIHGAKRISRRWRWLSGAQVAGLVAIASMVMGYVLAPLPLPGAADLWKQVRLATAPESGEGAIREAIGDASLSAQGNVGAHFSQRSRIYVYPNQLSEVDAVILRLESPTGNLHPQNVRYTATLAAHLQMPPAAYLASVACMLTDGQFGVALWQDPWLVFSRSHADAAPSREIESKLSALRREWGVTDEAYNSALHQCE